jgi:hypothetical protein
LHIVQHNRDISAAEAQAGPCMVPLRTCCPRGAGIEAGALLHTAI